MMAGPTFKGVVGEWEGMAYSTKPFEQFYASKIGIFSYRGGPMTYGGKPWSANYTVHKAWFLVALQTEETATTKMKKSLRVPIDKWRKMIAFSA